jgi:hypothetical protein
MRKIKSITAHRYFDSKLWTGYIVLERGIGLSWFSDTSRSRSIKKYLRERFPNSKKSIRVTQRRHWSDCYRYSIMFIDDAEEAEFILTCECIKGLEL